MKDKTIPISVICVILTSSSTIVFLVSGGFKLTKAYGRVLVGYYFVFLMLALGVEFLPDNSPLLSWFGVIG